MAWRESQICKSPLASELRHQQLYKKGTPPWKETYRKKCRLRLAESRRCLLQQLRMGKSAPQLLASSMDQILSSEFNNLQTSNASHFTQGSQEETDELLSMLEDVKMELMREEQKAIEDYIKSEGWMRAEDNEMDGWMDEYMDESNSASQEFESAQNTIVCPMCLKNSLTSSSNMLHCDCGLRVITETSISLPKLQATLTSSSEQHSIHCKHPPSFSVFNQQNLSNLLLSCKLCDFLYIII